MDLENSNLKLSFSNLGAEIQSLKYNGKEVIWQGKQGFWPLKAPILFPFCGFLKDGYFIHESQKYESPVHGFASSQNFELSEQQDSKVVFSLIQNEDTLKQYPFKFSLSVTYEVNEDELKVSFSVKNTDKQTKLPFSNGWHPGFVIDDSSQIKFPKTEFIRNEITNQGLICGESTYKIPDGVLNLNKDTFANGGIVLKNPQARPTLVTDTFKIEFNFDEFSHLVLWGQPGANFVCIEPWNGMGDYADHNHQFIEKDSLTFLEPEQSKTVSLTLKIKA